MGFVYLILLDKPNPICFNLDHWFFILMNIGYFIKEFSIFVPLF